MLSLLLCYTHLSNLLCRLTFSLMYQTAMVRFIMPLSDSLSFYHYVSNYMDVFGHSTCRINIQKSRVRNKLNWCITTHQMGQQRHGNVNCFPHIFLPLYFHFEMIFPKLISPWRLYVSLHTDHNIIFTKRWTFMINIHISCFWNSTIEFMF